VTAEPKSIHLQIDADPRLAAAAGGAARYFGDAAGLENAAIAQLQAATVLACVQEFEHLTQQHPRLDVTLTRLADRIEVALSHEGEGYSTQGAERNAGLAGSGRRNARASSAMLEGIDRVQHETRGGAAVTLLTKYVAQRNATR
jgi:signal transduction histidine kinase